MWWRLLPRAVAVWCCLQGHSQGMGSLCDGALPALRAWARAAMAGQNGRERGEGGACRGTVAQAHWVQCVGKVG